LRYPSVFIVRKKTFYLLEKMTLSSLNLSFEKHTSTAMTSSNTNDNSARNSVVVNVISPLARKCGSEPNTPDMSRRNSVWEDEEEPQRGRELPEPYQSPVLDDVEKEFKDQLLSFTMDLLLNDFGVMKNVAEMGTRVLFHIRQLKQLIAIQFLAKDDRKEWDSLIDIETEKITSTNCFCKDCSNPFYLKIKSIYVLNKLNFLTTPQAVNMASTFRISLEYCLTESK
jgi:hypothetical protein